MATRTDEYEHVTHAPRGQMCSVCHGEGKPLEPVRHGTVERASGGPPVVVHRHARERLRRGTAVA
ncbi:hypothetical protein [Streptomyces sp. NPDC005955]|uniref:hypothetical protein n=1 Tax=Streptomyces sp. NPDC005955 TaxID=3364738 RepID=UPI0036B117E6